jgi:hypothetical protein
MNCLQESKLSAGKDDATLWETEELALRYVLNLLFSLHRLMEVCTLQIYFRRREA